MFTEDFNPDRIARTAFFTGHRQIPTDMKQDIGENVYRFLMHAYSAGYRRFYCGCALGFDTLAAFQTVRLRDRYPDVILSAAVPCADQAERWTEKDREQHKIILNLSDEKIILSPSYYQGVMLARNRFMADRSSLCICYLTHMYGGTASTVRYALKHNGIKIVNLAMKTGTESDLLREKTWNYTCISPSVSGNAVIAPSRLFQLKKLKKKHT